MLHREYHEYQNCGDTLGMGCEPDGRGNKTSNTVLLVLHPPRIARSTANLPDRIRVAEILNREFSPRVDSIKRRRTRQFPKSIDRCRTYTAESSRQLRCHHLGFSH